MFLVKLLLNLDEEWISQFFDELMAKNYEMIDQSQWCCKDYLLLMFDLFKVIFSHYFVKYYTVSIKT